MTKPLPSRCRTTNWSSYNAAPQKRGSLLIWLAPHEGRPGRPAVFSNAALQFCLSIKVLFKLPLRQTIGMAASMLRMAGLNWPVPDYSTLCRRQKTLAVQIPYRRTDDLLVVSSGIEILVDGEWQARKHRVQGRRHWRKVHLAMDTTTSDIRAVEFAPSRDGDSPILPDLLDQGPEDEQIPPTAPTIPAKATTPSSSETLKQSPQSDGMGDCGRRTAPPPGHAMKSSARQRTSTARFGNDGAAITLEVAS